MNIFAFLQAEECDESFKKECEIEYFKVPKEEKVQICNEMLNRDCGAVGNRVCSKEYETGKQNQLFHKHKNH